MRADELHGDGQRDGVCGPELGGACEHNGATVTKYQYRYSAGSTVATGTSWSDVGDDSGTMTTLACATSRLQTVDERDDGADAFEVRAVNSVGDPLAPLPGHSDDPPSLVSNIRQSDPPWLDQILISPRGSRPAPPAPRHDNRYQAPSTVGQAHPT